MPDKLSAVFVPHLRLIKTVSIFFKNPSKTIDGYVIDAASVKASLDRIMLSETNTHGTLKFYLDNANNKPIKASEGQLSIKVAKAQWAPFVLNLLTSMDFSIVPKESLDSTGTKIIDYRNTSGFYFVETSDNNGNLLLKANSKHINYTGTMPDTVKFVPISPGDAHVAFNKDEIDMIDPTYFPFKADIEKY